MAIENIEKKMLAYALKNAIEHEGKAQSGAVLNPLFHEGLDRAEVKNVMPKINEILKKVNTMSVDEQKKELDKLEEYIVKREIKEGLPELENAIEGKVVTRLAPEPSKYNHIGHALVFLIQYLYAKKYHGKCILRFDDTNPEKSTIEYYNSMKEDLTWIGIKWDKEYVASENMQNMYQYAEKLIKEEQAFVCSCTQEQMKNLREKMKECKCKKNNKEKNMQEWQKMLNREYPAGEKTLRLKGNMKSNNGVMRDPVIFRISYAKHFLQGEKYVVWPMYDFENPIEDATSGVTHVIRSKEFELRVELQEHILKLLGLKMPIVREIGRYEITGAETQGRVIREMIEKGEVSGWDDPRLVTIKAMRRRGFVPEMFQQLAERVGLSKNNGHIDFTVLEAVNRKIIDPIVNRYSFIKNPVKIKVKNAPKQNVKLLLHPKDESKGKRDLKTDEEFFISEEDLKLIKENRLYRLMDCLNFKKSNKEFLFDSKEHEKFKANGDLILNWLPANDHNIKVKIIMPDNTIIEGLGESNLENLKDNEIIQFERFGFVKLDKRTEEFYQFMFTHK